MIINRGTSKKKTVHGSLLIIPLTLGVMFSVEGPDCIMNNILLFCGAHMWRVTILNWQAVLECKEYFLNP